MIVNRPFLLAALTLTVAASGAGLGPAVNALNAQSLPNQGPTHPVIPTSPATTPPGNDTTGYWQQRADYVIDAVLDETRNAVRATGELRYTNHSPDTLRELWLHQHLNAFRPGSRWSATDEREQRTRFQKLTNPDFAYERFTAPPTINGEAVRAEYPLAPDSSVVRLALPKPLAPGDSLSVLMQWESRPSTVPRRQGRRGRSYDFAQWYPRIAVYDRHGWKPNALVPAGEFYGEFGTFDVTLWVRDDQVLGATGIPVEGDPGWARVAVNGAVPLLKRDTYAPRPPRESRIQAPAGHRPVRFIAENVHHFGWSASPGFVYEGGAFVHPAESPRPGVTVWDTVAIHVLYRGDAEQDCATQPRPEQCVVQSKTGWENGAALRNGLATLTWLEEVFGSYPYPQMTMLKRLDGGGTEFPMMMQNGSNSAALVTHEGAHIYAHGILANNEWQSGWLDEGFASYVTAWQTGNVRMVSAGALAALDEVDPANSADVTLATQRRAHDIAARARAVQSTNGDLDPMGMRGDTFRSFGHYNAAVYRRAEEMYGALHNLAGDAAFRAFVRDYFARWAFRHVDRWAMQGSAERVTGESLGWFFDQWVDRAGVIEYAISNARPVQTATGWRTTVRLNRTGAYRHAMPVGVRTAEGWTVVRGDPRADSEDVVIQTSERPLEVVLDPFGATEAVSVAAGRITLPPARGTGTR